MRGYVYTGPGTRRRTEYDGKVAGRWLVDGTRIGRELEDTPEGKVERFTLRPSGWEALVASPAHPGWYSRESCLDEVLDTVPASLRPAALAIHEAVVADLRVAIDRAQEKLAARLGELAGRRDG